MNRRRPAPRSLPVTLAVALASTLPTIASPPDAARATPTGPSASPASPEALALLERAAASIGDPERLARLASYRIEVHASKRHRALESGGPVELPVKASVVWRRGGSGSVSGHAWSVEETFVGRDGNDEVAFDSCGRYGELCWSRLEGPPPAVFARMPAVSDLPGPRDPFHALLVELPAHRTRFTSATRRASAEIDGIACDVVSATLPAGASAERSLTVWIPRSGGPPVAIRLGDAARIVRLGDWRQIDGVRVPHEIRSEELLAGARTEGKVVRCEIDPSEAPAIAPPEALVDPAEIVPAGRRPSTGDT